jgi:hypothetical protein
MPDESRHDPEATARATADVMGLGVLDAVDVGGTWTVVENAEAPVPAVAAVPVGAEPSEVEPADRPSRSRLFWIGLAAAAAVLLFAMLISRGLPGPRPPGAPTPPPLAAPGATGQPGTASTPVPTGGAAHAPGGPTHAPAGTVVAAGQPQPTGFTPAPTPSVSGAPTPTPQPSPSSSLEPAPVPTASEVPISPTSVPPPSPAY